MTVPPPRAAVGSTHLDKITVGEDQCDFMPVQTARGVPIVQHRVHKMVSWTILDTRLEVIALTRLLRSHSLRTRFDTDILALAELNS